MKHTFVKTGVLMFAGALILSAPAAHAGFLDILKHGKGAVATANVDGRVEVPVACNAPIYAKVQLSRNPNSNFGVRNWGTGNLGRKIFVGGSAEANKYASGDWFQLYDGQNFKIDGNISAYEDVPGLAVQRGQGFVRLVLHGSWTEPDNNPLANRERAEGKIIFSNDMKSQSSIVMASNVVSDTENVVEQQGSYASSGGTNHPQNDKMLIDAGQSYFKFVVTTNDDGYYTYYKINNPACGK